MITRRKVETVKKETTVQKAYSTRRSTRLTEKKSAESKVQKDSGKAIKIDSFLDEDVSVADYAVNPSAEVQDVCNAKLDVLVVEKVDCSPVLVEAMDVEAAPKSEEKEHSGEVELESVEDEKNVEEYDQKPEEKTVDLGAEILDGSEEAEDENLTVTEKQSESLVDADLESDESFEQTLDLGAEILDANEEQDDNVAVPEEHSDSLVDRDASTESEANETDADEEMEQEDMEQESESENEKSFSPADEITTEDMEQESGNTAQEPKPEFFTEEKSHFFVSAPCFPPRATPIKKATPFRNTCVVSDDKVNIDSVRIPTVLVDGGKKSNQEIDPTEISLRQLRKQIKAMSPIKKATPFRNTCVVSDDKVNIDSVRIPTVLVDEGKKSNKEIDLTEISLRQLRKQIKAMSLKSNGNEDATKEAATARPALQPVCENH